MDFSPEQDSALKAVADWMRTDQQVFRLFGYAGTGKTTLAKYFREGVEGNVLFGAFTGKAAYVLQQKGCNASTLHSLAYVPKSKSSYRLGQLREKLKVTKPDHPKYKQLQKMIAEEENNLHRPAFTLNLESPLRDARLLIVDEVSMVNEEMGRDLESFGCKILVLGDPAQLPPVFGGGYFIDAEPDVMLTHIHRQARDNPIIDMATQIRKKSIPAIGRYGDSSVISRRDMTPELVVEHDQLLVGRNKTRALFNKRIREILNFDGSYPAFGDRLVCLRNNHDIGLLNGALWTVDDAQPVEDDDTIDLAITPEQGGERLTVEAHLSYFRGDKPEWYEKKEAEEFDYGYALTCHKAQGSQWNDVLVYDERMGRGEEYFKWLYTAVTRAAERVCLVRA